jgi:hypothetical protein
MFYIEDKDFLKIDHINTINKTILGSNFPFYFQNYSTIESTNSSALCHTVLNRIEERKKDELYNSEFGEFFYDILKTFCEKNNIKFEKVLRISVNFTFNNGIEKCPIHKDHNFPHKQLLLYINDPLDKNSKTIILDDDEKTVLKEIIPEKYKAVCFDNKPHFHYFPKVGERIVVVFTFI